LGVVAMIFLWTCRVPALLLAGSLLAGCLSSDRPPDLANSVVTLPIAGDYEMVVKKEGLHLASGVPTIEHRAHDIGQLPPDFPQA
jgi:hypothetical protein